LSSTSESGGYRFTHKGWTTISALAGIGTAVITLHGVTSKNWRKWHTAFLVTGMVAAIGAALTQRQHSDE
jgi:hypothetical protein